MEAKKKNGPRGFRAGVGGTLDAYIDYRVGVSGTRGWEGAEDGTGSLRPNPIPFGLRANPSAIILAELPPPIGVTESLIFRLFSKKRGDGSLRDSRIPRTPNSRGSKSGVETAKRFFHRNTVILSFPRTTRRVGPTPRDPVVKC